MLRWKADRPMSGWCWRRRPDPLNPSVSNYDLDEEKGKDDVP